MRPAPPEPDGDGPWSVGTSGAVHECSRCTDPSNLDTGPTVTFTFDAGHRLAAATTALKLSTQQQNDFLEAYDMTDNETSSARFMSLSYFGGGFPMVMNCSHDPEDGYAAGWYLVLNNINKKLDGSKLWSVHNGKPAGTYPPAVNMPRSPFGKTRDLDVINGVGLAGLVGFISGQAPRESDFLAHAAVGLKVTEDFLPPSPDLEEHSTGLEKTSTPSVTYERSGAALYTPIYNVFASNKGYRRPYVSREDATKIQATFAKVRRFVAGDYVFIDSQADGGGVREHGLMIIGHGPAVLLRDDSRPWKVERGNPREEYDVAMEEIMNHIVVTRTADESGWKIEVGDLDSDKYNVQDYLYPEKYNHPDTTVTVPYVVDWNVTNRTDATKLIRQKPRPFYLTTYPVKEKDTFFFNHNYWLFVPAAKSITLRCDWHYANNVAGDKNAPFLIDTDRSSSAIIKPAG